MSSSSKITLQQLVNQKIRQKDLSRSQLVPNLGYKNISKGCRRLEQYLKTLHPPSEEFVVQLLAVLSINGLEFSQAAACSRDSAERVADRRARERFSPHLKLSAKINISPLFVRQLLFRRYCIHPVPRQIQELSFQEEIAFVAKAYRETYNRLLAGISPQLARKCSDHGFQYFRHYDSYLEFNSDAVLVNIVTVQPVAETKLPLGNRVINMLSGEVN